MNKKALIFYISRYSGHYHAAKAIEEGLKEVWGDIDTMMINALSYTSPLLGTIINKAYLEVIKKKPEVWGQIYDNPEVMEKTRKARETLQKFNMSKIEKLLEEYSPDVVFCTQAFPCGMVANYKKKSGKDIFLVGVLTDYAPHSYWIHDEVDFYIAPSSETTELLERKGVSSPKIKSLGIPVDPKFRRTHDVGRIKKDLGFPEKNPTILFMGGSQGLGSMEEVVKALLRDPKHSYRLLVVTGSNKRLYSKMKRLGGKRYADNIRVMSYVENIDELMEAADIIVTKAGGMTVSEAMVKKLPMLISDPIPGHERMNTDFLVKNGAAVEVEDCGNLHEKINELFDSENALTVMRENVEKLSKPDSALDIARLAFKE